MDLTSKLFEPIRLVDIDIVNRIVMAPIETNLAAPDGSVTEQLINFLEERARGGTGLIITGHAFVEESNGRAFHNQIGIHNDLLIPKLNRLVEAIQSHGSKIFVQLNHAGRKADPHLIGGRPVAPSPMPLLGTNMVPRELEEKEIKEIVEAFGSAAERAQRAGFDGLEIHGAHGYLIAQFMSPHTNKRRDKYGGNLENRMRFPVEVIESIKRRTGTSYPVGFRFSGDEHIEDGINLEMSKDISRILEESGVSYLHVSCGSGEPGDLSSTRPADHPRGYNIHLAAGVKEVVHIPAIAVGALDDPQVAADTIVKGKADLIAIGRGLLADAYWPIKVMEGKLKDIQHCTRCNFCMRIRQGKEIRCPVNPALGKEGSVSITKSYTVGKQ